MLVLSHLSGLQTSATMLWTGERPATVAPTGRDAIASAAGIGAGRSRSAAGGTRGENSRTDRAGRTQGARSRHGQTPPGVGRGGRGYGWGILGILHGALAGAHHGSGSGSCTDGPGFFGHIEDRAGMEAYLEPVGDCSGVTDREPRY